MTPCVKKPNNPSISASPSSILHYRRQYCISADVLPLLHSNCGANRVNFLVRTKKPFVAASPYSFYWHGTIWIFVPLEETGAVAPRGKHEEERAHRHWAVCCEGHHRWIIAIRFVSSGGNSLHEASNRSMFWHTHTHKKKNFWASLIINHALRRFLDISV